MTYVRGVGDWSKWIIVGKYHTPQGNKKICLLGLSIEGGENGEDSETSVGRLNNFKGGADGLPDGLPGLLSSQDFWRAARTLRG